MPSAILNLRDGGFKYIPLALLDAAPLVAQIQLQDNPLSSGCVRKLAQHPNNALLELGLKDKPLDLRTKKNRIDEYTFYRLMYKVGASSHRIIVNSEGIHAEAFRKAKTMRPSYPKQLIAAPGRAGDPLVEPKSVTFHPSHDTSSGASSPTPHGASSPTFTLGSATASMIKNRGRRGAGTEGRQG